MCEIHLACRDEFFGLAHVEIPVTGAVTEGAG